MKSKNNILVGCLALLLVLSVGYALFSETVTINGTATAKGDFSLKVSCMNAEENELFVEKNEFKNVGVSDSIISCNGTTVTSSVSLMILVVL